MPRREKPIELILPGSPQADAATDARPEVRKLFRYLKKRLPQLEALLDTMDDHWLYEDGVYRFYHSSFKVYVLQKATCGIVAALQSLAPKRRLNVYFARIVAEGTGKTWTKDHNARWLAETRPIVEAFLHAQYFLKMAVRYGNELTRPPAFMPSGWAAFLYLYDLR